MKVIIAKMLTVVIAVYWDYSDQGQCVYSKFVFNNYYLYNKNVLFKVICLPFPLHKVKAMQTSCRLANIEY